MKTRKLKGKSNIKKKKTKRIKRNYLIGGSNDNNIDESPNKSIVQRISEYIIKLFKNVEETSTNIVQSIKNLNTETLHKHQLVKKNKGISRLSKIHH